MRHSITKKDAETIRRKIASASREARHGIAVIPRQSYQCEAPHNVHENGVQQREAPHKIMHICEEPRVGLLARCLMIGFCHRLARHLKTSSTLRCLKNQFFEPLVVPAAKLMAEAPHEVPQLLLGCSCKSVISNY